MPLESATYISDLTTTNPAASDGLAQADDHLRLLKSTIKATFPNVAGAVTRTHGSLNNSNPPGLVMAWPTATPPTGWLACTGAAVSRTTYALLFAVIGITYGAGDGSTTFNLPNAVGRTIFGYDAAGAAGRITTAVSGLDGATIGAVGGSQSFTLAEANVPTHTHSLSVSGTATTGTESQSHTHSGTTAAENQSHTHSGTSGIQSATHHHTGTTSGHSADHSHPITIIDPGHAHSYNATNTGTAQSGGGVSAGTIGAPTANTSTATTGITASSGGVSADHTHTFTSSTESQNHTHDITTGNASQTHTHTVTTGTASVTHTHSVTVTSAGTSGTGSGSGSAKGHVPPGIIMSWVIYTGL